VRQQADHIDAEREHVRKTFNLEHEPRRRRSCNPAPAASCYPPLVRPFRSSVRADRASDPRHRGDPRVPALLPRPAVVPAVRAVPADRAQGLLDRLAQLRRAAARPGLLAHARAHDSVHSRERGVDDGARPGRGAASRARPQGGAADDHLGTRPRLGDAGRRRRAALVLDDELRKRRRQLRTDEASRRGLHAARLVRKPGLGTGRDDCADCLGRDSVRRDHDLRRPVSGASRPRRGRLRRRRRADRRLPRRHLSRAEADPARAREPVDHLGLRGLHAAVPAPSVAAEPRLLPDEHLPVREVDRAPRVRPRLRDRDRDGADHARALVVLRPTDGAARRGEVKLDRIGWNALGVLVFAVIAFPVFWMVSTAFKPGPDIISDKPTWIPLHPTLVHFHDAIHTPYFWTDAKNSLVVVTVVVALSMVLALLAALALAKFRFSGRKSFIVLMITIQMLPPTALIIPLYVVLARYHQTGKLTGLIVTYMTFVLPFSIWTLRGFIIGIPRDLEEAAMVDGNTRAGAFFKILLPLVAPGLVATSVFAFIQAWNEFIFA